MNLIKLDRLYKERGLNDLNLKTEEDLYNIHSVKLEQVQGFNRLTSVEKENFIRFLINFYNAHSLENRDIVPLKVNIVLEKNYVINTAAVKDFVIRKVIIDEKSREILEVWQYDRFKDEKGRIKSMEKYMKFEYINGGQRSWLHINKSSGWY